MAAKAKETKKKSFQISKVFSVSANKLERKNKNCPKCGPGVFMAAHKDRESCGKCGYTQFKK
jgi:ubiquitin-small subunit ribosomal protein S27Ae